MFTGIVEEVGRVSKITSSPIFQLGVEAVKLTQNLKVSDSICVNGVCLTVTQKKDRYFEVQVMPQTLKKTNLGMLRQGDKVNLERALLPTSFLGGHFVTGDVDGLARVEKIEKSTAQWVLTLKPPRELGKYIVSQGRVAVEGVSLTVAEKENYIFKVCLIPYTLNNTTLRYHKEGDLLNLEVDILAKYVGELFMFEKKKKASFNLFRQAGYY